MLKYCLVILSFLVPSIFGAEIVHPPITLQEVTNIALSVSSGAPGTVVSSGGTPAAFKIHVLSDSTGTNVTPKSIVAGSGVTVTTNSTGFTIAATTTGTSGTMVSFGSSTIFQVAVATDSSGTNFVSRDILAGSGVTVTTNSSGFTIAATGSGGTVTGSGTAGVITRWASGGTAIEDGYLQEGSNFGTPRTNLVVTWGSSSNLFLSMNTSNFYVAGKAGIQSTAPATELHVGSTSTSEPRGIMSAQYTTDTLAAQGYFRKARGTEASPSILTTGDLLGSVNFSGYDGANYLNMAGIDVGTSGTVASTRVPTWMQFSTATDAAPSVKTSRIFIDNVGLVGIGTTNSISTSGSGLSIVESGSSAPFGFFVSKYSTASAAPNLNFRKARGTEASPTTLVTGDSTFIIRGYGYDGSAFVSGATIDAIVNGTVSSGKVPSYLRFSTMRASGNLLGAMSVQPEGNVMISDNGLVTATFLSSDQARLEVNAALATNSNLLRLSSPSGKLLFVLTNTGSILDNSGSNFTFGVSGISSTTASNITGNGFVNAALGLRVAGAAAKGSGLFGNGTNFMNTPVGTDGWILYADSTKSNGVNWAAAPSASSISMTVPGSWSVNGLGADTNTNFVLTENNVAANLIHVGPTSGGAGSPGYRLMDVRDIPDGIITVAKINATGTPTSSTYWRGDGSWSTVSAGSSPTGMVSRLSAYDSSGNLSNAWVTYANQYLIPDTNNVLNLGSTTNRFASVASVTGNFSGQITSTIGSGSGAPFVIASTTEVANLNAQKWGGKTLDYLNVGFILGDMSYWNASGNPTRLLPNQLTNIAFLTMSGQGAGGGGYPNLGNAPVWVQPTAGTNIVFTQTGPTNFTINAVSSGVSGGGTLSIGYFPFATGANSLGNSSMTRFDSTTVDADHLLTKRSIAHYGTSQILNINESFRYIDNYGLSSQQVLTLPFNAYSGDGLIYTFNVVNTNGIKVIPGTNDIIRIKDGVTTDGASGGYIVSSTVGDSITLMLTSNVWETVDLVGCGWVTHPVAGTPCASGGSGISGLTTGTVPYATSATTIGDSPITRLSSTNVALPKKIQIGTGSTDFAFVSDTGNSLELRKTDDSVNAYLAVGGIIASGPNPKQTVQWSILNDGLLTLAGVNGTTFLSSEILTGGSDTFLIALPTTITPPGTTGNQTINKSSGRVNIAAGGSSITVTDSLVTATSIVTPTIATDDATAIIKNCVSSSGSFTIKTTAAVTAETAINFVVFNP